MGFGDFPEDPDKRRVIVVVDGHNRERLDYEPGGGDVLDDPQSHVVVVGEDLNTSVGKRLKQLGLLAVDTVLLQSPFHPDDYAPIETAQVDFAISKHHLFVELCGLLGAKKVTVKELRVTTNERSVDVIAEGHRLLVTAEMATKFKGLDRLSQELSIGATFKGGEPDGKKVDEFLLRNRLAGDHHLASLARIASHEGNPVKKHLVTQSLTEKTKSNLEVAAKLKVPTFNFTGRITNATEGTVEFDLTTEIMF
jgi:hypothetical protein